MWGIQHIQTHCRTGHTTYTNCNDHTLSLTELRSTGWVMNWMLWWTQAALLYTITSFQLATHSNKSCFTSRTTPPHAACAPSFMSRTPWYEQSLLRLMYRQEPLSHTACACGWSLSLSDVSYCNRQTCVCMYNTYCTDTHAWHFQEHNFCKTMLWGQPFLVLQYNWNVAREGVNIPN